MHALYQSLIKVIRFRKQEPRQHSVSVKEKTPFAHAYFAHYKNQDQNRVLRDFALGMVYIEKSFAYIFVE